MLTETVTRILRNPAAIKDDLLQCVGRAPKILALAGFALLSGCIDSEVPILTDAQPLLGERPRLQLYALRDGAAHEPVAETFHWRHSRYVPSSSRITEIGEVYTPHVQGRGTARAEHPVGPADRIRDRTQARRGHLFSRRGRTRAMPTKPTRGRFCITNAGSACRVTTLEAVFAFAHATAAKAHSVGGLAVVLAEH